MLTRIWKFSIDSLKFLIDSFKAACNWVFIGTLKAIYHCVLAVLFILARIVQFSVDLFKKICHLVFIEAPKKIYHWVLEISPSLVFQTLFTLSVFGFIPGGWLLGIPLVGLYAGGRYLAYRAIYPAADRAIIFNQKFEKYVLDIIDSIYQLSPASIVDYFFDKPFEIAKFFTATFIFLTWSMPFSLISIYGLYRFAGDEWFGLFKRDFDKFNQYILDMTAQADRRASFYQKCGIIATVCALLVGYSVASETAIALIDFGLTVVEVCATAVGFRVMINDFKQLFDNPIKMVLENVGKFASLLLGRRLAYELFPGRIVGDLGVASGHVLQNSTHSMLFNFFFPVSEGKFIFNNNLLGAIYRTLRNYFNSLISSIYFSHQILIEGDFYGYIGPTGMQVFVCMAVCFLAGMVVDRIADRMHESIVYDRNMILISESVQAKITKINSISDKIYDNRWNIAFASIMMPLILASPASSMIASFTLDSHALAGMFIFTTSMGSFNVMDYVANAIKRRFSRAPTPLVVNEPPLPEVQPTVGEEVVVLNDPPPSFTPHTKAAAEQERSGSPSSSSSSSSKSPSFPEEKTKEKGKGKALSHSS